MDNMEEARRKRAAALEEKRKRLEELRRKRAEREGAAVEGTAASVSAEQGGGAGGSPKPKPPPPTKPQQQPKEDKAQLDELINSLLAAPAPSSSSASGQQVQEQELQGASSLQPPQSRRAGGAGPGAVTIVTGLGKVDVAPAAVECYSKGTQTDPPEEEHEGDESDKEEGAARHRRAASGSTVGTSTSAGGVGGALHSPAPARRRSLGNGAAPPRSAAKGHGDGDDEEGDGGSASSEDSEDDRGMGRHWHRPPPVLTEAEREAALARPELQASLARASLVVERALGQDATHNILVDYGAAAGSGLGEGGAGSGGGLGAGRRRKEEFMRLIKFCDEGAGCGVSGGRAVMALDWSPHYNELLLAAYGRMGDGVGGAGGSSNNGYDTSVGVGGAGAEQPDGLVLVWSLGLPSRPEYRFRSPSPVLTAKFHDHDPHLILGGTYSGQVVLWDTRAKSLPVQRTPLSANGHSHPVYSLGLAGDAGAPTLVTASSDGKVCYWSLSQLHEPIESVELRYAGSEAAGASGADELDVLGASGSRGGTGTSAKNGGGGGRPVTVAALAMDRAKGGDELVVGSESGHLYLAPELHKQAAKPRAGVGIGVGKGSGAGVGAATVQPLGAHYGLVTSLALHPCSASRALSGLLLSASVDWSMRLWSLSDALTTSNSSITSNSGDGSNGSLLATLTHGSASCDYVVDAQWCPAHPAAFASATAGGALHLWNLGQSMEVPVTPPFYPVAAARGEGGRAGPALTKLAWSGEGRKLAVGDAEGGVHVLGVDAALVSPRVDEEVRLEELLRGVGAGAGTVAE